MQADDLRLLGIPRSRPIITMIYPHHDAVCTDCPGLSAKVADMDQEIILLTPQPNTPDVTLGLHQCSARVARDIKGHHRPVIAWRLQRVVLASQCKRKANLC